MTITMTSKTKVYGDLYILIYCDFMVIYGDLWWFMVIHTQDLWWFMIKKHPVGSLILYSSLAKEKSLKKNMKHRHKQKMSIGCGGTRSCRGLEPETKYWRFLVNWQNVTKISSACHVVTIMQFHFMFHIIYSHYFHYSIYPDSIGW